MIIDSHAHLNFHAFDDDREEVIKRSLENNIHMINIGTNYINSKLAIDIAESFDGVYASVGLHPSILNTRLLKKNFEDDEDVSEEEFDEEKYLELAKNKKVVAIGEVGLDYWRKPKGTAKKILFKQTQKKVLLQNIAVAQKLNLPLILHCRVAHDDLWEIIKDIEMEGVVHCFTGSVEDLERYLNKGLYIGFNGIIFNFPSEEIIKKTPLDRILVETDCPYLTPTAFEGKRNEPLYIKEVIKEISRVKEIPIEKVEEQTTLNAIKLFRLNDKV